VEAIAGAKASPGAPSVTVTPLDLAGSQGFDSVLLGFYKQTLGRLPRGERKRASVLCEEGLLDGAGHRLMLEERQITSELGIHADTLGTLTHERVIRRER